MSIRLLDKKKLSVPRVKLGVSRQIVIPKKFYTALDLAPGDYLKVELSKTKQLVITPEELVDKHSQIEKRLVRAESDIRTGRVSGPFKTTVALARHLKARRA